jgi:hypothetical protein
MATNVLDRDLLDEINAAREASRAAEKHEPRAKAAAYNPKTQKLELHLKDDSTLAVDINLIQGLENATDQERSKVRLEGGGYALHWDDPDVDISVPGLAKGVYGTKAWMTYLGQKGGKKRSVTKAEAARKNGIRGGRPSKKENEARQKLMKAQQIITVEVALPDQLVYQAQVYAKSQGVSINEIYQKALEAHLAKHHI